MNHTCVICLEDISHETSYTLPCNHVLHIQCFEEYFLYNYDQESNTIECPICKEEFGCPLESGNTKSFKKCIIFFLYSSLMTFFTYKFLYISIH